MELHIPSLLVILFRLVAPLSIFRWPLLGALLAIVADALDVMIASRFGWGHLDFFGPYTYHNVDKILDIYYLSIEWWVALRWSNVLARRTATTLFWWRALGALVFEFTRMRWLFVIAPNIFENFYITWTIIQKWFHNFQLTPKKLAIILIIVGIPKIAQEYFMHYLYVDQTWTLIRENFFWWLY